MKNQITNEQIKQAFARPELLRELFPNAFKLNLEAGKWYCIIQKNKTALFNFSGYYDEKFNPLGYGFDYTGAWIDSGSWTFDKIYEQEIKYVKEYLKDEIKKRNFKKGIYFKTLDNSTTIKVRYENFCFFKLQTNNSISLDGFNIFKNGKWAEIIKQTEIELTLDEIAEKFGVDKVKIKK